MMEDAWLVHEVKTTANFARSNPVLCWYVGGLNFQIEHHLFPRICSIHYPAISPIVEEVAKKYDIPYHHHPTLGQAVRSHLRMLKQLGQPAPALTG
jgi:linoleoyl-CoA desaturase